MISKSSYLLAGKGVGKGVSVGASIWFGLVGVVMTTVAVASTAVSAGTPQAVKNSSKIINVNG
jgi:hypothetical protein